MTDAIDNEQKYFEEWAARERLFMRFAGLFLLLIAGVSIPAGMLDNPEGEEILFWLNIGFTVVFVLAGVWELWRSAQDEHVAKMIRKFADQPSGYARIAAFAQIFAAFFFLIEGLSGNITLFLLAALILVNAGWLFKRDRRTRHYQSQFYEV